MKFPGQFLELGQRELEFLAQLGAFVIGLGFGRKSFELLDALREDGVVGL